MKNKQSCNCPTRFSISCGKNGISLHNALFSTLSFLKIINRIRLVLNKLFNIQLIQLHIAECADGIL